MQTLVKTTETYKILKSAFSSGRLSHAYVLSLDDEKILRPFLKTLAALYFENVKNAKERIERESFSDCLIFPKDSGKFLTEDAERIVEESAIKPIENEKKLFVITDFSKATQAAQNKLLKVLEEPPENVYFLIGTTSTFSVLPTVLSRCKQLDVPPFSTDQVTDYFVRNRLVTGKDKEHLFSCACLCGGRIGLTEKLIADGDFEPLKNDVEKLLLAEKSSLPAVLKKVGEPKYKKFFFSAFSLVIKDAIVLKSKVGTISLKPERFLIEKVADKYSLRALFYAQNEIVKAEKQLFFNAPFSQCLQVFLTGLALENEK